MTLFDVLALIGGLSLFMFGMNVMGQALERRAGSSLQLILSKLTSNRFFGFLTGLGVTAVIQSSSATTVMVVGFVNSGLMTLKQSISVIMGANVGTTVTAWILSLSGISGDSLFIKLLKPTSFTPILALIGVVLYLFCKSEKKKDVGTILLGFATLMFGMNAMSDAVSGLENVEAFRQLFIMFENPFLGMLAGAILTAIIQSSSASVGILQALAVTGQVSYGAAIPIIMGQNIGTCVTAMLSSVGTTKNAKRAAIVHLSFNVIGTAVWLSVFSIIRGTLAPAILGENATLWGIAVCHSAFNVLCTILMLPLSSLLEKVACIIIPEGKAPEQYTELDERLLVTPALALEQSRRLAVTMAELAVESVVLAKGTLLLGINKDAAKRIREIENKTDHYEDTISTFLIKLSSRQIGDNESAEAAMILRIIGDCERIADHSVNLLESSEELAEKKIALSESAMRELTILCNALEEIVQHTIATFSQHDLVAASHIEPLEEVIDKLKDEIRARHIARLQSGNCTVEAGFVLSDILTNIERVSDHCSNIAGCVLESAEHKLSLHENTRTIRSTDTDFDEQEHQYEEKYSLS
ncbi:MAG: Na/Pi cotransporter family protein [Clostridia bacterium]|nr:Na/Pi cotransporter family protein [Clostridia bacterium]